MKGRFEIHEFENSNFCFLELILNQNRVKNFCFRFSFLNALIKFEK